MQGKKRRNNLTKYYIHELFLAKYSSLVKMFTESRDVCDVHSKIKKRKMMVPL